MAFRNLLVHRYDQIDYDAVWVIVKKEVPVLLEHVEAIFEDLPEEP